MFYDNHPLDTDFDQDMDTVMREQSLGRIILKAGAVVCLVGMVLGLLSFLAGCQNQAGSTATTQPSYLTLTTQAEDATKIAVDTITLGMQTQVNGKYLISAADWTNKIRPIVIQIQAVEHSMEQSALNDQTAWQASNNALVTLNQQLQPYLAAAQKAKTQ